MIDIVSSSSNLPDPSPDIEEALLTAASKPLVIRGLIAELRDCLGMVEADIIDKLHD